MSPAWKEGAGEGGREREESKKHPYLLTSSPVSPAQWQPLSLQMLATFSFYKIYGPTKGDLLEAGLPNTFPPQAPHSGIDISNVNAKAEASRKIISLGSAVLYNEV